MAKKTQNTEKTDKEIKETVKKKTKPKAEKQTAEVSETSAVNETPAASETPAVSETPVENKPKRRGRPPKLKPEDNKENTAAAAKKPDKTTTEDVAQAPKKRRGRPPKKAPVEASIEVKKVDLPSEITPDTQFTLINSEDGNVLDALKSNLSDADDNTAEEIVEETVPKEDAEETTENKASHKMHPCVKYILLGLGIMILVFVGVYISYALNEYLWTVVLLLAIAVGIAILIYEIIKFVLKGKAERKANEQI